MLPAAIDKMGELWITHPPRVASSQTTVACDQISRRVDGGHRSPVFRGDVCAAGALWDRLWHPLAAQRPAVKWGLALAVFLALAAVSYWGAGSLSNLGVRYLASSKRFSSDDLIKVCRALDKQRIAYRVDEQRRVEVDLGPIRPGGRGDLKARPGPASD